MAKLCGRSDDYGRGNHLKNAQYPDMRLYQEIIFLQHYYDGKWIVENVISYYIPLIEPQQLGRHYFWSNFTIEHKEFKKDSIRITGGINPPEWTQIKHLQERHEIILPEDAPNKRLLLRNCVNPEVGKYILEQAFNK
jgi:DNA (cytosine-5)-methyltransferase 1